jgi:hypothetical protein
MQVKCPPLIFPDIDHPTADHPITKHTDAKIIERVPFAESVTFLEHSQFLVEPDVPVPHGVSRAMFPDRRNEQSPCSLVKEKPEAEPEKASTHRAAGFCPKVCFSLFISGKIMKPENQSAETFE